VIVAAGVQLRSLDAAEDGGLVVKILQSRRFDL